MTFLFLFSFCKMKEFFVSPSSPLFNKRETRGKVSFWQGNKHLKKRLITFKTRTYCRLLAKKTMEQRIYIVYVGLQHTPIFRAINHCLGSNHTELISTKSYTFLPLWFSIQSQVQSSDSALFLCKDVGWGDQRTLLHLPCCSCVLCRWQLFCYNFITKNNWYLFAQD